MEPLQASNASFQGGLAELLQAAQEQLAKSNPPSPKSLGKRRAVQHVHPFSPAGHFSFALIRHASSEQGAPSGTSAIASSSTACPPWSDWLCCDLEHQRAPDACSTSDFCTGCHIPGPLPCHGSPHCSVDSAGPSAMTHCSPASCCESVVCNISLGQPCDASCSPASACHDPVHGAVCTIPAAACCDKEDCGQEGSTCTVEQGQCTSVCPESNRDQAPTQTKKASDCAACNLPMRTGQNRLYSSFQELLDCCCCCASPPVEADCCSNTDAVRSLGTFATPHPVQGVIEAKGDMMDGTSERFLSISTEEGVGPQAVHRRHHQLGTPSSVTLSSFQRTSVSANPSERSRASTISSATSTAPMEVSTPQSQHEYAGGHLFAKHGSPQQSMTAPVLRAASPQYHALMKSTFNASIAPHLDKTISDECQFSRPHRQTESGGCLPPSWTLCNSTDCSTEEPHSHWATILGSNERAMHSPTFSDLRVQSASPASTVDGRSQMCRWGGCNERFWTVEELVAHVNHSHLAKKHAPSETPDEQAFHPMAPTSSANSGGEQLFPGPATIPCMWNDCNSVSWPESDVQLDAISSMLKDAGTPWAQDASQLNNKTSAAMLQHLLMEHLGPTAHTHAQAGSKPRDLGKRKRYHDHPAASVVNQVYHGKVESGRPTVADREAHWERLGRTSLIDDAEDCGCDNVKVGQDGRKGHVCGWKDCSEIFPDHQSLTEHITNDHVGSGKAVYECRWVGCERFAEGKKFAQKQKVLRHIQTHTGDRPHKCEICGRRFSEPNTLAQHMRTHTQEKPYVCDYSGCGKSFSVAGSLTIHKRVHSGAKPFKCKFPGCGKTFAESSNLTKHARIHSGERPFGCPECGKRFSRPDQVSRHRKTHERKRAKVADAADHAAVKGQSTDGAVSSAVSEFSSDECISQHVYPL